MRRGESARGGPRAGSVRVVAGRARGLRLRTLPGLRVRPTADRVKEALFSLLGHDLGGTRVVDCFAGTGALGIEAWSRGAASVILVEEDPAVLRVLDANLDRLPERGSFRMVRGDALEPETWGAEILPADLILADPPYRSGLGERLLRALARVEALAPGGRLVLEHESGIRPADPAWDAVDRRRYGDTGLSVFTRASRHKESDDAHRHLPGDV